MVPISLAAVILSLPLLYIVQTGIDGIVERRERAREREESGKRDKRARILRKRAKRRAAVAIIREMEREMQAERPVLFGPPPAFHKRSEPSPKRSG